MLEYLGILRSHDWKEYRSFDFRSDGQPVYIAAHRTHKAATSDSGWQIVKLSYDSSGNLERWQGPLTGVADDRASLDW